MVKVTVDGEQLEYEKGTTYLQIAKDVQKNCEHDIILAKRGEKLIELNKSVNKDQEITFLTTASDSGYKTYVRGVTLLMLCSFYHVAREKGLENIFLYLTKIWMKQTNGLKNMVIGHFSYAECYQL